MLILSGHETAVADLAFSPDGRFLASCGLNGTVSLWDTQTSQPTPLYEGGGTAAVFPARLAFTPCGTQLVIRSNEEGMRSYDITWKACTNRLDDFRWVPETRPGLAISPIGHLVVTDDWDPGHQRHIVRQFNSQNWDEAFRLFHITGFHSFAGMTFDPTGRWLAMSPGLLDIQTGMIRREFQVLSGNIQWSPRDPIVASALVGDPLWITDVNRGKRIHTLSVARKQVQDFAFSPDGRFLAAVSNEELVRIWDTTSWREHDPLAFQIGKLKCIAFAPDGQRAACGSESGKILVWDWDL